jgi:hypothetical protein
MESGSEIVLMNELYRERFPKATRQMEERLQEFLDENTAEEISDGILRFVHHQVRFSFFISPGFIGVIQSGQKFFSFSYIYLV